MNRKEIRDALYALGIRSGMKLIVHSSLSSIGFVEGGAMTVVEALMDAVTQDGTILMPSFNQARCYWKGEVFDVRTTPTINGAVPEAFRTHEGVLRSENPTHAYAAWGRNAVRYTAEHRDRSTHGYDSPIYRLMEDGGYCLLLGVGYDKNTFHHCVEQCEAVPCLRENGEIYDMRLHDGTVRPVATWSWRNGDCPADDFGDYGERMTAVETVGKIGNARCRLYRLSDAYPIIADGLRRSCPGCHLRPRVNEHTI